MTKKLPDNFYKKKWWRRNPIIYLKSWQATSWLVLWPANYGLNQKNHFSTRSMSKFSWENWWQLSTKQQVPLSKGGTANLCDQCLYVATKDNIITRTTKLQRNIVVALIRAGPFFFLLWFSNAWGFILAMECNFDYTFTNKINYVTSSNCNMHLQSKMETIVSISTTPLSFLVI